MKNRKQNLALRLPVPVELIERRIYLIRGLKVMLDADLAELYQVKTFRLNEAVKRNEERFPGDFMFQLTEDEAQNLRSQFAISSLRLQSETSKKGYGGRRYLPYVFTEQGVAMLSSVLSSKRAIAVNIAIMRAFVKLRELMTTHKNLARKMEKLEDKQNKQGLDIKVIFKLIEKFLKAPKKPKTKIGFRT